MPQLTGVVAEAGYEVLAQVVLQSFGYGLVVYPVPALPLNPYMGFTFPVIESLIPGVLLASQGRKMYRDGAIVIPSYVNTGHAVIAIWSPNAVGRSWSLQY